MEAVFTGILCLILGGAVGAGLMYIAIFKGW